MLVKDCGLLSRRHTGKFVSFDSPLLMDGVPITPSPIAYAMFFEVLLSFEGFVAGTEILISKHNYSVLGGDLVL